MVYRLVLKFSVLQAEPVCIAEKPQIVSLNFEILRDIFLSQISNRNKTRAERKVFLLGFPVVNKVVCVLVHFLSSLITGA